MKVIRISINIRIKSLQQVLQDQNLETAIIFSKENRRYFADFYGSNGALIISQTNSMLLTDSRYIEREDAPLALLRHTEYIAAVHNSMNIPSILFSVRKFEVWVSNVSTH